MAPEKLIHLQPPYVLLENSLKPQHGGLLFEDPHAIIVANETDEVKTAFDDITNALNAGDYVAGYMNYELGLALEPKLQHRLKSATPLLWFGVFKEKLSVTTEEIERWLEGRQRQEHISEMPPLTIQPEVTFKDYQAKFEKVKQAITAGDIYQLNLTFKAAIKNANPISLYSKMRRAQPVEFASFINTGDETILSASPELFIEKRECWIETRPMKGTLKRGPTTSQDQHLSQSLREDQKSRAENLMIVDLMRNDFGRIAEMGTVSVDELFKVETFPSLHQMISIVRARQKKDISLFEQMQALFPPGSITGAPKIRAMELIDDLEQSPRSIYTGAIGYFSPNTDYIFNVAIRTVRLDDKGTGEIGIGSGLVFDSDAKSEYEECLLKMKFLKSETPEFSLIETIGYNPQKGLLYLEEHLSRLQNSAEYFAYISDIDQIKQLLFNLVKDNPDHLRIRLLLQKNGSVSLTPTVIAPPESDLIWQIKLVNDPLHSENVFLYHKTTNRSFYDEARVEAQKQFKAKMQADDKSPSLDEVIFQNERGELTEGSITNLFIKKNGKLITPPITSGLLCGTLRQSLIESGEVTEAVLYKHDLESADEIYVGNSVRGLIKANLVK